MHRALYKILFLICLSLFTTVNLWAQPACLGDQGQLKWLFWENLLDDELDDLTHLPAFPNNPDVYETITALKSLGTVSEVTVDENIYESAQYGTYYGSMIRGYLTVPENGNYTFNITGDDEVKFLLSTNDTRELLTVQASVDTWAYRLEYDKETNQTSGLVNLQTDTYYYFEVWHKEHSGGDHFEVKWKTPSNTAEWLDIPNTNLYDFACALDCPPSGTPCDDGDVNTTDDQQDGFCNCTGTPTAKPSCVGNRGEIKALYYLDIPGNSMNSFLEADKYPLMPDTSEFLERMQGPLVNRDTYGTKIAGLIKVPITGAYQFSVTCDDRASFALSTTDSPEQLVELSYSNWSNEHDQYDEVTQIRDPVNLDKDNFYYFEMHHREGTGGDRFSVFWRTPFTQDTLWRYIDPIYIYGYACEMACIPEGTPCDDNNKFTKNDQYDAECNCVGTPCRDCDETPEPDYTATEDCGVSNQADNAAANAWESCLSQPSPNTGRGNSHWIQYDLGQVYLLNETHIWNYNASGATGKGFKDVVVDYSTDGSNWTQLGDIYEWAQATGNIGYEGFEGPNFNGITARYILITALNNWDNGLCHGFSKITINATDCLLMGQSCDDGDANSVNDRYDENCNCIGEGVGFEPCGETELIQDNITLSPRVYRASARIQSQGMINSGSTVELIAGESVTLKEGFLAQNGSEFLAQIINCESKATIEETEIVSYSRTNTTDDLLERNTELQGIPTEQYTVVDLAKADLVVSPNPTNSWAALHFNLPYNTNASLCIYTTDGKKITCLAANNNFEKGTYRKEFPAQRLAAGMYYVVLKTDKEVLTKPLVVLE